MVSIVIPTRNRRDLLALALASALGQRDVDIEILVVDEASTDDTAEMVTRVCDPRVRLVRHEVALGKAAARNRGVEQATGVWIAFLDDDDLWAPDKLALQLRAASATGLHWSYTGAVNVTTDHRIIGGAPPRPGEEVAAALPRVNGVPGGCSSVMVRRSALPAGGFDGRYRLCEDWDLWIRLAQTGPPACVRQPLVGYRVHAGNSSADTTRLLTEVDMIEKQYGGPVDRVVVYRHVARLHLRMNRQWPALRCYGRAARQAGSYRSAQFLRDAMKVLQSASDRALTRLRGPRQPPQPLTSDDATSAWRDEARVWLHEFIRHRGGGE